MGPLLTLLAATSCAPEMTPPEEQLEAPASSDLSNPGALDDIKKEILRYSQHTCSPAYQETLEGVHKAVTGDSLAESDTAFICLDTPQSYKGAQVDVLVDSDGLGDTFALTSPYVFVFRLANNTQGSKENRDLMTYLTTCVDTEGCFGLSLDDNDLPHVFPQALQGQFDEKLKPSVIVDSALTWQQALGDAPCEIPQEVLNRQKLVTVKYWGLTEDGTPDQKIHQGQIVVDQDRVGDVEEIFDVAFDSRFPIHSVVPVSQFEWHDAKSMEANNTSGFNYRHTGSAKICPGEPSAQSSRHASVRPGEIAVDINDRQNPYCTKDAGGERCEPKGAVYNPETAGTLTPDHTIIKVATAPRGTDVRVNLCSGYEFFCTPQEETRKGLGWMWGGNWKNKDWQHLQTPLSPPTK